MASTMFIVFLCLSVRVASSHGGIDGTGSREGIMTSAKESVTADETEEQEQSMKDTSSSAQLASLGLAELVNRMTLFSYALNLSIPQCEGGGDCGREQNINKGLAELVHRMTLFSHALNLSIPQCKGGGDCGRDQNINDGLAELVHRMTLFSHALNLSNRQPEGGDVSGGDGNSEQQVIEGLTELVQRMTLLSEALTNDHLHLVPSSTTRVPPLSSASTTSAQGPRQQPCLPPFELIAYRMCILQEMQLKLSWNNAQEFCRERGAELAQDMTVIKTRRFLNDLYGEDGTRSRWPVWVGGRRVEQTWTWAENLEVPSFLWAPNEPREYSSDLMPEGLCMILDGYRRFHGASLPCHLRRRFICQLRD